VDKAVRNGIAQYGQYLILEFDFSCITRPSNLDESAEFLAEEISIGLSRFKSHYADYLGPSFASATSAFNEKNPAGNLRRLIEAVDVELQGIHARGEEKHALWNVQGIYLLADEYDAYANEYMDPHDTRPWTDTKPSQVLKAFWSTVKAGRKSSYAIKKVYITGVTPLLLSDIISGADHDNVSFNPEFSTICGLTRSDVLGALKVICNNEEEVQTHLRELAHHANGYHFCQQRRVEPVFNTQTALSYLQVSK